MKSLVVREINQSVELMDKFENGDYDYLELEDWFGVNRDYSATGFRYVSVLVSKERDDSRVLSAHEPTMTELRRRRHKRIDINQEYKDIMAVVIQKACQLWKTDQVIKLPMQICLRAQTSLNRMDYGCEWLGGGDWVEKTLYGETTDFYIDAVILKERSVFYPRPYNIYKMWR